MNLIEALNSYFSLKVENAQQFKQEYKEEFLPHAQAENLLNFLLWYERQEKK